MNSKQRRLAKRLRNIHTGRLMFTLKPFSKKDISFLNKIATKLERLNKKVKKSNKKVRNL